MNVSRWLLSFAAVFTGNVMVSPAASGEEYKCENDSGCPASITNDGEVETHQFRKGDMVSTEAGWFASWTDDGWTKIKSFRPQQLAVYAYVVSPGGAAIPLGARKRVPHIARSYGVPITIPMEIATVGI